MVSSKLLVVTTLLITAYGVQAMDHQSPAASASSSPQSSYRGNSPAALTTQETYNVGLFTHLLNDQTIKPTKPLDYFDALLKDLNPHIRGASMNSKKLSYLRELQNLRSQAALHIEQLQKESSAAHSAALARAPRLKSRQLHSMQHNKPKQPLPPAQQPRTVVLPAVAHAPAAPVKPHKQQKPKKQSSIQAVHAIV